MHSVFLQNYFTIYKHFFYRPISNILRAKQMKKIKVNVVLRNAFNTPLMQLDYNVHANIVVSPNNRM